MERAIWVVVGLGLFSLAACIKDECQSDSDCGAGQVCLDELKLCARAPSSPGGSGGSEAPNEGGSGGRGGADGEAGHGGDVDEPAAIRIPIELFADPGLTAYLDLHPRTLVQIRLFAGSELTTSTRLLPLENLGSFSLGETSGYSTSISFQPESARDHPDRVSAELFASTLSGGSAILASDRVETNGEDGPFSLKLALDPAFDFDEDGAPDGADCAPDDPGVTPGEIDICDGVDTSCNPGICYVPVPPGFGSLRGFGCNRDRCYSLLGSEDDQQGVLLSWDRDFATSEAIMASGLLNPNTFAVDPQGHYVSLHRPDDLEIMAQDVPRAPGTWSSMFVFTERLARAVRHSSPVSFALGPSSNLIYAFTMNLPQWNGRKACTAQDASQVCSESSLDFLSDGSVPLDYEAIPVDLAVNYSLTATKEVYVLFERERRMGFLAFNSTKLIPESSTLFQVLPPTTSPRAMSWTDDGDTWLLLVAGGSRDEPPAGAAIWGSPADIRPFDLPAGSCPSQLRGTQESLYVVDDCQDLVWRLPLKDDLPDASAARSFEIPDCKEPRDLAHVQQTMRQPEALAITCPDVPTRFYVIGRD